MSAEPRQDAITLLRQDHLHIRQLFENLEYARDESGREDLADQIDLELRVHSLMEEELLYPALRDFAPDLLAEAFEEHGVVEQLLNELATMPLSDEQFEAKFKVMRENVEHHVEEEESEIFPQCLKIPGYDKLGSSLLERKQELLEDLSNLGDPRDRAVTDSAATRLASEKSEAVLATRGTQRRHERAAILKSRRNAAKSSE